MKKHYVNSIAIFFLILSQQSFSQTITAGGINPVIGDVFNYKTTAHFNEGSSGSGQVWNYPSLTGTTQQLTAVSVASTPYASYYPSATIAEKQGSGTAYLYYSNSASAQQTRGYAVSTTQIVYSNPEEMLHFPFSLGNSYVDNFVANFTSGGYSYTRRGTTTVTADASGTLTTPAGTFTNVLRVRIFQDYQDSTNLGGSPYIIDYTNDEFLWYKDGFHYPLASTFTFVNNGTPSTSGSYLITSTIGIDETNAFESNLNIFPNPATSLLTVEQMVETQEPLRISLMNVLGEKLAEIVSPTQPGSRNEITINVEKYSKGIYLVLVSCGDLSTTRRIVIE
ncbi:MAG: T9SS type A sorting domain-containing protein [Bacteroidetes bacterium]|nr:T9SS type A sorting domain-containing protein [Bacteroidota bacterium]